MTLGFSQVINGKPTYFIEKIWQSILENRSHSSADYLQFQKAYLDKFGKYWDGTAEASHEPVDAKTHTIRQLRINKLGELAKNQWDESNKIHFAIHNRTTNYFQFAPVVPVISIQDVFMTDYNGLEITVDDTYLYHSEKEQLAKNDGFDSLTDFEDYFISQMKDGCFSGIIIHWTNLKY